MGTTSIDTTEENCKHNNGVIDTSTSINAVVNNQLRKYHEKTIIPKFASMQKKVKRDDNEDVLIFNNLVDSSTCISNDDIGKNNDNVRANANINGTNDKSIIVAVHHVKNPLLNSIDNHDGYEKSTRGTTNDDDHDDYDTDISRNCNRNLPPYHHARRSSSSSVSSGSSLNHHHDPHQQNDHKQEETMIETISLSDLIECICNEQRILQHSSNTPQATSMTLSPELERRVRDFRLAQHKRWQRNHGIGGLGENNSNNNNINSTASRWGIFGMYQHLNNLRSDLEWVEDAAYRRQHNLPYVSWTDYYNNSTTIQNTTTVTPSIPSTLTNRSSRNHFQNHFQNQYKQYPWFTYTIVVICSIMLLVEFYVNDWKIEPLSINPMIGPSAETLLKVGARDTSRIVINNEWYRLVSPMILHAGIVHFVINMIALLCVGTVFERNHKYTTTLIVFVVPGIGGNVLSALFLPQYISVGASGSIFGILGGCIADIVLHWKLLFIKQNIHEDDALVYRRNFWCVFWLVIEILVNIIMGLVTPFIDNWTHLGGLVYGSLCAFSIVPTLDVAFFGVVTSNAKSLLRSSTTNNPCTRVFVRSKILLKRYMGVITTFLLMALSTAWLATMQDPTKSPCPNCRYISCVPFPFFQEEKWWYCDDCDFVTGNLYKSSNNNNNMTDTNTNINKITNATNEENASSVATTRSTTTSASSMDDYYVQIDLICPNETIVQIDVSQLNITKVEKIQKALPKYCRSHCADKRK